jgi:putative membrane protein
VNLIVRLVAGALGFWAATTLISGVSVNGGAWSYLWVALIFGLINGVLGSIIKLLTLPAILLSLGLFSFVINAAMLMLTARWSDSLDVVDFWSALWASLIISIVTTIVNRAFKTKSGAPYDPVSTRWLCPNCHMKTNCCDGAPCEIVEVKESAKS